jgi:CheY-like chemotaxis protein
MRQSRSPDHYAFPQGEKPRAPERGLRGRRILIVEDEVMVALMLQDLVESWGCVVAGTAGRLEKAVALASTVAADVALLDLNLHGEHSRPVSDFLLARGIPVVVLTGYGPQARSLFPLGEILQKPAHQEELREALLRALAGAAK